MDLFTATMIAEGAQEPDGETDEDKTAHYDSAWQYLIDTGAAWQLQGFFGRTATAMIDAGHCTPVEEQAK